MPTTTGWRERGRSLLWSGAMSCPCSTKRPVPLVRVSTPRIMGYVPGSGLGGDSVQRDATANDLFCVTGTSPRLTRGRLTTGREDMDEDAVDGQVSLPQTSGGGGGGGQPVVGQVTLTDTEDVSCLEFLFCRLPENTDTVLESWPAVVG